VFAGPARPPVRPHARRRPVALAGMDRGLLLRNGTKYKILYRTGLGKAKRQATVIYGGLDDNGAMVFLSDSGRIHGKMHPSRLDGAEECAPNVPTYFDAAQD